MLRIYKNLVLNARNPAIKNRIMTFSSRPGDMESKDDFFTLPDTNMIVSETSLLTFDSSLYKMMKPESLPAWTRAVLANRMAETGEEWAKLFIENNSGTHNNQWLVLDYKPEYKARSKKLYIIEQYFNIVEYQDITENLYTQGYWASYNFPLSDKIRKLSKIKGTFTSQPRAILFAKYSKQTKDFDAIKRIVQANNQETGDYCPDEIAPRCDLYKKGKPYPFGNIDSKASNEKMMKEGKIWMISAPTMEDNLPPFSWNNFETTLHRGIPETFDFPWCLYNTEKNDFEYCETKNINK